MHLNAPPSKAHTLRGLFLGALANGKTTLYSPLVADDQKIAISALAQLGARISIQPDSITIQGSKKRCENSPMRLHVGNSGVSCRFLTTIAPIISRGSVTLEGDEAMQLRPLTPLLNAIAPLGIQSKSETGCPPVTLQCQRLIGGETKVPGNISSQYLSALLLAAPFAERDVAITVEGPLKSAPYVEITISMMRDFGAEVTRIGSTYHVKAGKTYRSLSSYTIEGDYSNASYFFARAAVTGTQTTVKGLLPDSLQGDKRILDLLKQFGCLVKREESSVTVTGKSLMAIEAEMSATPDLVPTVAVMAAFAKGTTEIHGVGHLRYKETDRLEAIATELKKMGICAIICGESLQVTGGTPRPAVIETYNDHRMAMAFAVAQKAVPGITLCRPECVSKSFPNFFELWQ